MPLGSACSYAYRCARILWLRCSLVATERAGFPKSFKYGVSLPMTACIGVLIRWTAVEPTFSRKEIWNLYRQTRLVEDIPPHPLDCLSIAPRHPVMLMYNHNYRYDFSVDAGGFAKIAGVFCGIISTYIRA